MASTSRGSSSWASTVSRPSQGDASLARYSSGKVKEPSPASLEGFLPYLPQDDAVAAGLSCEQGALDAVETQEVADLLNSQLSDLLRMVPVEFWDRVTRNDSIQASLNSYLQFRRRWYDSYFNKSGNMIAGVIVGDQELHRRVFMVLYRMSSHLEPGVPKIDCLSQDEHREILRKKQLFDIPILLDICAIYGHNNQELTHRLVSNVFMACTTLKDDLFEAVLIFSRTVQTMYQRCFSTLQMLLKSAIREIPKTSKLQQDFTEILYYLTDAVFSLRSFIDAYPEGVIFLVSAGESDMKEQLLPLLALIHDALLPTMHKALSQLGINSESHSRRLRLGLIELAWQLLCLSYLSEEDIIGSLEGASESLIALLRNPSLRGEAFVEAISNMVVDSHEGMAESVKALLRNLGKQGRLLSKLDELQAKGLISLDTAQYDYLVALTCYSDVVIGGHPVEQGNTQEQEQDIMHESKITHIKDILPNYGNGFIAACLEAYDNNPEEVIQRILEGTLHPSLQSLDVSLEIKPDGVATSQAVMNKGKGKAVDKPSALIPENPGVSNSAYRETVDYRSSSSMITTTAEAIQKLSLPSLGTNLGHDEMKGRFVRKEKGEGNTRLVLDDRESEDITLTAFYAAQYEDEYDDSFDDLGIQVADAVEETETLVDLIGSKTAGDEYAKGSNVHLSSHGDNARTRYERPQKIAPPVFNNQKPYSEKVAEGNKRAPFQSSRGRGRSRREEIGQYFVKDGKNYNYKVAGSIAVASLEEADALKQAQEDTILGLGRGGNVPASRLEEAGGKNTGVVHGEPLGRGGGRQNRGRGGFRKDHYRKDGATRKHFASVGGV